MQIDFAKLENVSLKNYTSIDSAMLPYKNHMDEKDVTRFGAGARSTQTDDAELMQPLDRLQSDGSVAV